MPQNAFLLRLKPECAAEYERRHATIWPALAEALRAAGIREYFIFLEPTSGLLFGVQHLADGHTTAELPQLPIMRQWWDYMADLMETNPDNSPAVQLLQPVFSLE